MPTVAVLNMAGKEVEKIELAEGVFGHSDRNDCCMVPAKL